MVEVGDVVRVTVTEEHDTGKPDGHRVNRVTVREGTVTDIRGRLVYSADGYFFDPEMVSENYVIEVLKKSEKPRHVWVTDHSGLRMPGVLAGAQVAYATPGGVMLFDYATSVKVIEEL